MATNILPDEKYPKEKLKEIENLLAADKKAKDETEAMESQYRQFIIQGDNSFRNAQWDQAKSFYNKAIALKNETYPKDQIAKIEAALSKKTTSTVADSKDNSPQTEQHLSELAKKYPPGVTIENVSESGKQVKKVVVVRNGIASEYKEVKHSWGGIYCFKNGKSITPLIFSSETKPEKDEKVNTNFDNK